MADKLRSIAFYLPQYHPTPENDEWWGRGFTEWTNVSKARAEFAGHYQPHLPADLGYYDLRLPEVREAQASLAREYGIHGFCYYHYWFNGRRILERPFNEVLESGSPDFPFCLCWANENWTRTWDGGEHHVLLGQNYSHEDDRAHIRSLIPAFRDPRYIKVDGRPLFLVYRTELLPNPAKTAEIWREECRLAGLGEIYLARVENFERLIAPAAIGFDAAIEFAPDTTSGSVGLMRGGVHRFLANVGLLPNIFKHERIINYQSVAKAMAARTLNSYPRFRCVTPMWDNSARRGLRATVYTGSHPRLYEQWLTSVVRSTRKERAGDEKLVFINAWNEWGEGCHLEPDLRWGRAYLEATRRALSCSQAVADSTPRHRAAAEAADGGLKRYYWRVRAHIESIFGILRQIIFRIGSVIVSKSNDK